MPISNLLVQQYFDVRRGLASGIVVSGNVVSGMFMPLILQYLLIEYGIHGGILIYGGILLHGLIGAALFQPAAWHYKPKTIQGK